jgi:hypothetical protein
MAKPKRPPKPPKIIDKPGFYPGISEPRYLEDPVIEPSLNNTICKMLVNRSPRHARYWHPRLNPNILETEEKTNRARDIGSAVHSLILGEGANIAVIPYDDYKKHDAQDERDEARDAGLIPLVNPDMEIVLEIEKAAKEQLADEGLDKLFTGGQAELTMAWKDRGGVWCRSRLDYLHDEVRKGGTHITVPELKTTVGSAHPLDWQSIFFDQAYDYQAGFYERGLKALLPSIQTVEFMWIVLEQKPPYGLSIVRMGNQAALEASTLVEVGIDMWSVCMAKNEWPGYDTNAAPLDPAFWRSNLKEQRRLDALNRIALWQRPQ